MDNEAENLAEIASAINRMAKAHHEIRKRPKMLDQCVDVELSQAVENIHNVHGDGLFAYLSDLAIRQFYPSRAPKDDGSKYPWSELKERGDSFLWPYSLGGRASAVRASIAVGAIKKFGPGVIKTRLAASGILVTRIA